MFITAGGTVLQYFFLYCTLFSIKNLHFQALPALSINIGIGLGTAFGAIASGYLVSQFGQTIIVVICWIILACTIMPVFMFFSHGVTFLPVFLLLAFLAIFHGAASGTVTGILARLFPMSVRTTGIGCAYSLAVTIFGGTAQPAFTIIIKHSGSSVSWCFYVAIMAFLSTIPFLWMRKRLRDEAPLPKAEIL